MGNDEHGPAYPEPPASYRCPVCGINDRDAYLRCYDGGCPDGRDQSRLRPAFWDDPTSCQDKKTRTVWDKILSAAFAALILGTLFWLFTPRPAPAFDHGFDPLAPTTIWMESLIQPANPPGPCCGKADAYQADTYRRNKDGSYTVTITDGSAVEFPAGGHRTPLADGTVIEVSANHVNPPTEQAGNPTGHAWIFLSVYGIVGEDGVESQTTPGTIYCFVPLPEGS